MKLSGSLLSAPLLLAVIIVTAYGSAFAADPLCDLKLTLPGDSSVRLCEAEAICYDVVVTDSDVQAELTLTLVEGPIDYPPTQFGPNFTENICFTPDTTGLYRFIWQVSDLHSNVVTDTVIFSVSMNIVPVIEDQYFAQEICFTPHPRLLPVRAYDPDCDTLRYELLEGLGTIEKYTGLLEYDADTSGVYTFVVAVLDDCAADTATIYDTIYVNQPPELIAEDFTVKLCTPEEICFDLLSRDPEGGPVMVFQSEGPGQTTELSDSTSQTCFVPFDIDSASYLFVYCSIDECPYDSTVTPKDQSCITDTVVVTVLIDQPPRIICPDTLRFFTCELQTFCFDVEGFDPELSPMTFSVLSGNATIGESNPNGVSVCIEGDQDAQFDVVIEVADTCGHSDTCTVPISIHANRPPRVVLTPVSDLTLCQPETICSIEATADDDDLDLETVEVNYGYYDKGIGRICFDADTSGLYEIIMTATDSCGAFDTDTTYVTVHINELPQVTMAADFSRSVCAGDSICFSAFAEDDNPDRLIITPGFVYDETLGTVCFTPDGSGIYEAVIRLTDDCDQVVADTTLITVDFNSAPVVANPMSDTSVYLCAPDYICLPLEFSDIDNDIVSVSSNRGEYADGSLCFIPYGDGEYQVIVIAIDDCGNEVADTATVTVLTDQGVALKVPNDTSIFLCEDTTLYFHVDSIPEGATVTVSGTGTQWDAETQMVSFFSDCCIENLLTVSATTECGTYSASFNVTVETNVAPLVIVPQDTSFFFCEPTEIRLPLGASDPNGNLDSVKVEGKVEGEDFEVIYDDYHGEMFFTPDTTGVYTIIVTATDSCGAVDTDQIRIDVVVNSAPTIAYELPTAPIRQCALSSLCVPLDLSDADGNIATIETSVGEIITDLFGTTMVCAIPDQFGEICFELILTDSCGAADTASFCITVEKGDFAYITCPTTAEICTGELLTLPLDITGDSYTITSSLGEVIDGVFSFVSDTAGVFVVDIDISSECNTESCQFEIIVEAPPEVTLSADFDKETLFLCSEITLHPTYTLSESVDSFTVVGAPGAWSTDGTFLELTLDVEGIFEVLLIGYGDCGVDTASISFTIEMNEGPIISARDTSVVLCSLIVPIGIPVDYSDADGNIEIVSPSMGEIVDDTLYFTAPDFGDYEIIIDIKDSCEWKAADTISVSIIKGEFVTIEECPVFDPIELCGPGEVCFPIDITGTNYQVTTSYGTYADGEVCFEADTSGIYSITITGDAGCNNEICVVNVDVTIIEPVALTCQENDTVFFCEPGLMGFPLSFTGDDVELTIAPAGAWYENDSVFVNVDTAGLYEFEITASNQCNTNVCSFSATVEFNSPPELGDSFDTAFVECSLPEEICLPFTATDPDDNLLEVRSTLGVVNDNIVCFTPQTYGDHDIVITAVDDCGAEMTQTIKVSITEGSRLVVECPVSPLKLHVATPAEGRIPISILPMDAEVTVEPFGEYDASTGEIVAFFEETGVWEFTVVAKSYCDTITCTFMVEVDQYFSPEVICIGAVDTAVCVVEPVTVCLPIQVSGTDAEVISKPTGQIVGDEVCIEVDQPGEYIIELIAFNDYEADTCYTTLVVLEGVPADVSLPEDYDVFICEPENVCVPVDIQQTDFDIQTISTNIGEYNPDEKNICFTADAEGTYEIIVDVTDVCGNVASATVLITVTMNSAPQISLGEDFSILLCAAEQICVDVDTSDSNMMDLIPNMGQYDPTTGQVCFQPEGEGSYELIVEATDLCGSVTADTIIIEVKLNVAPTIEPLADTTVYLCFPDYICLDALFDDVDGNIAEVSVNRGQYEDGTICFIPYGEGSYEVILTVTDSCGLVAVDTAIVLIKTDQGVNLKVPNDTSFFLCENTTLYFPVDSIPEGAVITVSGTGTQWDAETQMVSFYSDCCIENLITVIATTPCGTYSKSFNVTVETNAKPLVIIPNDTAFIQCELTEICFPVGASDPDGNLDSVTVEGEGFVVIYDDYHGQACFTPTGSGTYTITVTATDSCGAVDVDQIVYQIIENQPPTVEFETLDFFYKQCEFEQICLSLLSDDEDGNFDFVTVNHGTYSPETGQLCFMPDSFGVYDLIAVAYDSCGAVDSAFIEITVAPGDYVTIDCPTDTLKTDTLCKPEEICHFLDITGDNFEVTTSFGSWVDGRLCFPADTSGIYEITVTATSQCATETCVYIQPVKILDSVTISRIDNQEVFLCGRDTLKYFFTASESVTSISVSSPAWIDGDTLFVPIMMEGILNITMTASGRCGKDSYEFTINTDFNVPPVIVDGPDSSLVECTLFEVCLPLSVSDEDNNIASLTSSLGVINEAGDTVCFTPLDYGVFDIVIDVVDECGKADSDTMVVSYLEGDYAQIICPVDTQFVSLCKPDTVPIPVGTDFILPLDAEITITPNGVYDPQSGLLKVMAETGGLIPIKIIAKSQCGSDTCEFILDVEMGIAPDISAPTRIDDTLCLAAPTTLCFDADITGTGVKVYVSPVGEFSAGTVCVPIDTAGSYKIEIIASGNCGTDTAYTQLNISADQLPQLFLPEDLTFERCPDDMDEICIDGIFATDAESSVTLSQVCGPVDFVLAEPDSGSFCWLPLEFGLTEFCYEISDGCHTVSGSFNINIVTKPDCEVCVRATIDGGEATTVGLRKTVAINVETNDDIAGFDLLISYDASALTFVGATIDNAYIEEWEYFTYNLNNGACGTACPSGLVRMVGIADVNNGAAHPPDSVYSPQGALVYMQYQIANDQNLGDQFIPISFVWYDCGDNTFSDASGTLLYMDLRILDSEGNIVWDEDDDTSFPDEARPFGMGAPDQCLAGTDKSQPLRCIEFINGGIKIKHPDEIDDRGDINLDGLAYTIADVVIFTNYFIHGLTAFTISIPGQIAATDVNADGITLSVADLVLLIRVIVGDADPIPKVVPYPEELTVAISELDGKLTISSRSVESIGGAYLVYKIPSQLKVTDVRLAPNANQMDMEYLATNGELRVLIYDVGTGMIESGLNDLLEIDISGSGSLSMTHLEFVDYQGRPYETAYKNNLLPDDFTLDQNYPNPFNPSTHIGFYLPQAGQWQLQIYGVTGTLVRSYDGYSEAGEVTVLFDGRSDSGSRIASGVYFYRLQSNSLSATKKMILLK